MPKLEVLTPAQGSRVVRDEDGVILFGQPPEVLKGLLISQIDSFDTLVLTDVVEKDGSLLNNLEFPIYFFLFVANGMQQGKRLNLIGTEAHIKQMLRLLRVTLMGPIEAELDRWGTNPALKNEWLSVGKALALKDDKQQVIPVEGFFNICPFVDGKAQAGHLTIEHQGQDTYQVSNLDTHISINLNQDQAVLPPY